MKSLSSVDELRLFSCTDCAMVLLLILFNAFLTSCSAIKSTSSAPDRRG
jgi:hypothetical protein